MTVAKGTCSIPDCPNPAGTKGICRKHYRRQYYAAHREHEIKTATERAKKRKARPAALQRPSNID